MTAVTLHRTSLIMYEELLMCGLSVPLGGNLIHEITGL